MSLSRRHFFRNLGLGSAGLLSTPFIVGRGHEAMAFEAGALQPPDDGGFIRISSNENARGPGKKTMDALRNTISPRVGRGYPPDYTGDLVATIRENLQWIGHFHTAGVPGRLEINDTQEINYRFVARSIADLGFTGYISHEFRPSPGRATGSSAWAE